MTERTGVWLPLRKGCPQVMWTRIENLVSTGIPDVNGVLNGSEAWLELKYVASGFKIHFQPTQPPWIFRRALSGGRVYVLARKGDVLYLYHGQQIRELVVQGLRLQPVLRLAKPFDWYLLLSVVFGYKATESLEP
jgi:hypothetical protein